MGVRRAEEQRQEQSDLAPVLATWFPEIHITCQPNRVSRLKWPSTFSQRRASFRSELEWLDSPGGFNRSRWYELQTLTSLASISTIKLYRLFKDDDQVFQWSPALKTDPIFSDGPPKSWSCSKCPDFPGPHIFAHSRSILSLCYSVGFSTFYRLRPKTVTLYSALQC
jgi:hypothetical protein